MSRFSVCSLQGMTHEAIAEHVGIGLTTIQNWLLAGSFPERKPREQSSQLDPYRPFIEKRWSEGYHNLMGIYRELQAQGYQSSYENIRARFVDASSRTRTKLVASIPRPPALPSKRRAVWLFLRRREDLRGEEQEIIMRLRDLHPDIDLAYLFVQQFAEDWCACGREKNWMHGFSQLLAVLSSIFSPL